jgi:ribosomal protein L37E
MTHNCETVIVCRRCGTLNRVAKVECVAEEFGITCRRCGTRGIYRIENIRTVERS